MKKAFLIIAFLTVLGNVHSQSFSTLITPSIRQVTQGNFGTIVFTVNVVPAGGFNATVNYELIIPPRLSGAAWISTTLVNNPYPKVYIHVDENLAPPGTHSLVVKSFNGTYVKFDTCALVVAYDPCPDWFRFNKDNSVASFHYGVCTGLDKSENFWMGTILPNAQVSSGALYCYDKNNNWYEWTKTGHTIYNASGAMTYSTTSQKIFDYGIIDIGNNGDTVYAISSHSVYTILNKSLSVMAGPSSGYEMTSLSIDNNGELWAGTIKNVYRWNGSTWNGVVPSNAPFGADNLSDFEIDKDGHIWFSTSSGHLFEYDGIFWTTHIADVFLIERAKDGTLWVGADYGAGISRYNYATSSFTYFAVTHQEAMVHGITFNSQNNPVVATTAGVYIFNGMGFTGYDHQNSAVVPKHKYDRPRMASMDSYGNIMVANENAGLAYHCVYSSAPIGITENSRTNQVLKLYPNPASSSFQLSGLNLENGYQLVIYDISGAKIHDEKYYDTQEISFNLNSGLYLVQVTDPRTGINYRSRLIVIK